MTTLPYSLPILTCLKAGLAFVFSGLVASAVIPIVIREVKRLNLLDTPNERKAHKNPTPTLGGIGVFAGILVGLFASLLSWISTDSFGELPYLLVALIMLFGVGIMDDLHDFSAKRKFLFQIGAALLVAWGGVRLSGFYGMFGITEVPVFLQYTLTVILIVGVTNAVNLIDGIDGLSGGLGFTNALVFALLFALSGDKHYAILAFAMAGSLLGFLRYNFNPAKIFMGDTGALVIGFLQAVMGIKLVMDNHLSQQTPAISHSTVIVFGILLLPVADTLRLFTERMLNGKSPFKADRNHIHHLLMRMGCGHKSAAIILYIANISLIVLAFFFAYLENFSQGFSILLLLALPIVGMKWLFYAAPEVAKKTTTTAAKSIESPKETVLR
ncbi:MAG: glycosyltransferase family 4 protein [Bacteroidia bacterium]